MTTTLFASLAFRDADRAMDFLRAIGFTERAVYRDPDDPTRVQHAQFDWRDAGGVMFGSADPEGTSGDRRSVAGHGRCYLVVEQDQDVDRVHAAALAAGARELRAPVDMDYGGRGSTVVDVEGNEWSLGSYPGEPAPEPASEPASESVPESTPRSAGS